MGVRCRLLCGPAPREAAAPHSFPHWLRGTTCQGLQAASGIDSTNMTPVAGAGSEAGGKNRGEDSSVIIYTAQRKD